MNILWGLLIRDWLTNSIMNSGLSFLEKCSWGMCKNRISLKYYRWIFGIPRGLWYMVQRFMRSNVGWDGTVGRSRKNRCVISSCQDSFKWCYLKLKDSLWIPTTWCQPSKSILLLNASTSRWILQSVDRNNQCPLPTSFSIKIQWRSDSGSRQRSCSATVTDMNTKERRVNFRSI